MKLTNNRLLRQFIKYTFAGGTAFVLDISILYSLTEFAHIHYLVSAAIAFLVGLTTNYIISVKWVFEERSVSSKKMEFLIFAIIGIFGLGINHSVIWLLSRNNGLFYINSKLVATGIVYFFNFFVRKFTLFKDTPALEVAPEPTNE